MSSPDPFQPLSGTERWTASLDALRQRQQELANLLAQAQKQAAQPLATKTPPSPTATGQVLHDKFTDQFAQMTATVQQQQAAYSDAVAKGDWAAAQGHLTTVRDAWQQLLGAGDVAKAGLDFQSKQAAAQQAELEARARQYASMAQTCDDVVRHMSDVMQDITQKLGDIVQAQNQVASKIWS
jgi:hypothetical protein